MKMATWTFRTWRACCAVLAFAALMAGPASAGEDEGWPREVTTDKATIIIYQPQPETFEGNVLTSRAAVSVTPSGQKEPVFGAIWAKCQVETDRVERTVNIVDVKITDVRFPEATDKQRNRLTSLLEAEIPKWELSLSLDQLLATLAASEQEAKAALNLNNTPPAIRFSSEPAVLVTYDGQPELREIEDTKLMRVINTPFPVILETTSGVYHLSGGEIWYRADDPLGPWTVETNPPRAVTEQVVTEEETRASGGAAEESTMAPKIVVATEPTELLVADGEPKYSPISGTNLLYMSNTESDVLLEITSQAYYVLLSGRWFTGAALDGPWTYVPADRLPADFARIPLESANGHLLTFVAGTESAREAVMDNQIPQTAAVKRGDSSLAVTYDGNPQFTDISGTDMAYAVNTSFSVLRIGGRFYCCNEAVWYEAGQATGPWAVCASVPSSVQQLPPDCPVYNVKYVQVYEATPQVVYVGYTPGYMGSYVYGPCVVYGTGYYYRPWWGPHYYYPRPATWSFHVRYNPWYGWSYGLSYSSGPFRLTVGIHGSPSGWYGPRRYSPYPYRSYHKTNINVNRNININTGDVTIRNRDLERRRDQDNIYDRSGNRNRNAPRAERTDRVRPQVSPERPNNVIADREGNVHRRTDQGWEKREGGNWTAPQSPRPADAPRERPGAKQPAKPQQRPGVSQTPTPQQMDREMQARQRGNERTRQAPQASRGSRGRR